MKYGGNEKSPVLSVNKAIRDKQLDEIEDE